MNNIASILEGVRSVAIAGHTRPDGDCVGSCMGMYLYLKENYPEIQADVYLEEPRDVFSYIEDIRPCPYQLAGRKSLRSVSAV